MSNDTKTTIFGIAKCLIAWAVTVSFVGVSTSNPLSWFGLAYGALHAIDGYFTNKSDRP